MSVSSLRSNMEEGRGGLGERGLVSPRMRIALVNGQALSAGSFIRLFELVDVVI
jgi:hypothetical protein